MFTEFFCNSSAGSNLNGGSDAGSPSATDTASSYGRGTGAGGVDRITASSGTPFSAATVGQFVGVNATGSTSNAGWITAVLAVNGGGTSIDVADGTTNTRAAGSRPANNASADCRVGGIWQGPSATTFPIGFSAGSITNLKNAAGNPIRFNLLNTASYGGTFASFGGLTQDSGTVIQGCTATAGDGGKATISGTGSNFSLLSAFNCTDLIFTNNFGSGSTAMVTVTSGSFRRCVFHDCPAAGVQVSSGANNSAYFEECEFYSCNTANNANNGGIVCTSTQGLLVRRCVFHDIAGSNSNGIITTATLQVMAIEDSIFDTIGASGVSITSSAIRQATFSNCDFYNNTNGISMTGAAANARVLVQNCNFVKNVTTGILVSAAPTLMEVFVSFCGFGSGSDANGANTNVSAVTACLVTESSVNYTTPTNPWVDPANGNFRIAVAATQAQQTGRGTFTETASNYTGTQAWPDIGSAQSSWLQSDSTNSTTPVNPGSFAVFDFDAQTGDFGGTPMAMPVVYVAPPTAPPQEAKYTGGNVATTITIPGSV